MSLTITASNNNTEFKSVEAGNYLARCVMVIDLGTQKTEYLGEVKNSPKVFIRWELNEFMEDGRPFIIGSTYTASLHEKAVLRQHLESWRGKKMSEEDLKGFGLEKLLGTYCMCNVTTTDKGGKTYSNVSAITSVPKGMAKFEPCNPLVYFDMSYPDMEVFNTLPKFLQEKIQQSAEWKLKGAKPDVPAQTAPMDMGKELAADDTELPF